MRKPYNPVVRNFRKDGTLQGYQGSMKGIVIPEEFDSLYRMKVESEWKALNLKIKGKNNGKNT